MSGHSKWATTKHKKAVLDAKRSQSFAKLIKTVEVAAKLGGPDPAGNPTLADAIQKAKKQSVPNDNIERAIKRGAGLLGESVNYTSVIYEAYATGGVAMLVECLTDNKNRAATEVRTIINRMGGSMADPGSVLFLFERMGEIIVPKEENITEDALLNACLDHGLKDIFQCSDHYKLQTAPQDLVACRAALQKANIDYDSAEVAFHPVTRVDADAACLQKLQDITAALEDLIDVQNVYTNINE